MSTPSSTHDSEILDSAPPWFPTRLLKNRVFLAIMIVVAIAVPVASAKAASGPKPPIARTIAVGSNPIDVVVSPGKSYAFVANDGSVSTINLGTRLQVGQVGTGNVHGQTTLGLAQNGAKAYIGVFDKPGLTVMSTATQTFPKTVTVGRGAAAVATAHRKAFIALLTKKRVAVVNTVNDDVIAQIKLPASPQTAQTAPDGASVWIGSADAGTIWVVNASSNRLVRTVNVQNSGPIASIAFGKNHRVWISGIGGVSVVNSTTGRVLAFIPITRIFPGGPNAGPIALNPSNTYAMLVNSTFPDSTDGPGSVAFVNTKTLRVTRRITLGNEPTAMAIDTKRRVAYVTNYKDDTLSYFSIPR